MRLDRKQPVHWCEAKPDKTNPMKLKRTAIGPAGQVVEVSLACGKTTTSMLGNNYGQLIQAQKEANGWVWYDSFEDDEARDALIAARREAKSLKNEDYAKLFETKLDKLAKVLEASAVGQQRPVLTDEQLAAAMAPEKPAPKTKKAK